MPLPSVVTHSYGRRQAQHHAWRTSVQQWRTLCWHRTKIATVKEVFLIILLSGMIFFLWKGNTSSDAGAWPYSVLGTVSSSRLGKGESKRWLVVGIPTVRYIYVS